MTIWNCPENSVNQWQDSKPNQVQPTMDDFSHLATWYYTKRACQVWSKNSLRIFWEPCIMYVYIYSKVSPFNWIPMAYGLGRPENHGHLWSLWDLDLRLATWLQLGQEMDGMVGEILTLLGTGWWSRFNFRFALKWNDGPKLLWCGQNMILIRNAGPKQFHPQCPVLFKFVTLRCHQSYEWALKCENHRT